jgi:tetratricopeptide (TPR) repeat protein
MRTLQVVLFWILIALKVSASAPTDTFKLANEAFERGAIEDAIMLYESILTSDFHSPTIYHNLGVAYLRTQNWPNARYYLEKGLLQAPLDAGLNSNLNYIREKVGDSYNFPSFPFTGLINKIHQSAGQNIISIFLLVVFLVTTLVFWLKPGKWQLVSGLLGATWVVILMLFLLERKNEQIHHDMAIVWNQEAALYDKPDEISESISIIYGGHKVRIMEKVGPWYQVDLADGTSGWIEAKELRLL